MIDVEYLEELRAQLEDRDDVMIWSDTENKELIVTDVKLDLETSFIVITVA